MKISISFISIFWAALLFNINSVNSQQNVDFTGVWGCSYVQQYRSVDIKDWQILKISNSTLQFAGDKNLNKFSSKNIKKNVYRITYQDGVLEQFTVLNSWMMIKENSEQTQICLRQDD